MEPNELVQNKNGLKNSDDRTAWTRAMKFHGPLKNAPDEKRATCRENFYKAWERQELLHRKKMLVIEYRSAYFTEKNADRMFEKKLNSWRDLTPKNFKNIKTSFDGAKTPIENISSPTSTAATILSARSGRVLSKSSN